MDLWELTREGALRGRWLVNAAPQCCDAAAEARLGAAAATENAEGEQVGRSASAPGPIGENESREGWPARLLDRGLSQGQNFRSGEKSAAFGCERLFDFAFLPDSDCTFMRMLKLVRKS